VTHPLCEIAVDVVAAALRTGTRHLPSTEGLSPELLVLGATFVTLERNGRLLGCVGTLDARQPLAIDTAEHALAAAFDDPRLPAVTRADFPEMSVKVSVLSRSEAMAVDSYAALRDAVRPGVDGITVAVRSRRATLLPSVWEKIDSVDAFLDALWNKAGLRARDWPRGVQVSRYTTVEHTDTGPRAPLA
jgi:AmmeMemoRadiSam system protein A